MNKIIVIGLAVMGVIILLVAAYFWYAMGRPLYQPGMVREGKDLRAPLVPPEQAGDAGYWTVEPYIQLQHFAQGEGKDVLVVHGGPGYPYTQPWSGLEPLAGEYRFHYYDQRGCGGSTRPIDRFTPSNYYETMLTLDRTLGIGAQLADIERIRHILDEENIKSYRDFGSLFQKSEADLAAMNEQFGAYYQAAVDIPLMEQGEPGGWMV